MFLVFFSTDIDARRGTLSYMTPPIHPSRHPPILPPNPAVPTSPAPCEEGAFAARGVDEGVFCTGASYC